MVDTPDDPADDPVAAFWDDLLADMAATAAEYRDRGWETLALHPGDVTPLAGPDVERRGFDVLLPDNEFADLLDLVDAGTSFDASEVYATTHDGVVFLVVVMRDADRDAAVLFPVYYRPGDESLAALREVAREAGVVRTHLRRLARDRIVTFAHDDPALFFDR